jgi:hypothetical protein
MQQAGVPEGIAADVVGHEKKTITYGLYASGSEEKQKLDALSKVSASNEADCSPQRGDNPSEKVESGSP